MYTSHWPRADVSCVNVGFLLFVLDSADAFCFVRFWDFIISLILSERS